MTGRERTLANTDCSAFAHIAACALTVMLALSANGCSYALGGHRHVEGAELPYPLPSIAAGASRDEVIALLGVPTTAIGSAQEEELIWREVVRPRGCRIYLFGIIPLNREPRAVREVHVTLRVGEVERAVVVTRDRGGKGSERSLEREGRRSIGTGS